MFVLIGVWIEIGSFVEWCKIHLTNFEADLNSYKSWWVEENRGEDDKYMFMDFLNDNSSHYFKSKSEITIFEGNDKMEPNKNAVFAMNVLVCDKDTTSSIPLTLLNTKVDEFKILLKQLDLPDENIKLFAENM